MKKTKSFKKIVLKITMSMTVGTTHGRHVVEVVEGRMGVLKDELMIQ